MAKTTAKVASKALFGTELMPGALSGELIGTFILTTAVLVTSSNIIVIAIAYMALSLLFGKISGGHLNPIVTVSLLATKQISPIKAFGYLAAQLLGAMLALIVVTQFLSANTETAAAGIEVFKLRELSGTWVPVMAEALGGLIFGLAAASAHMGKREGLDGSFMMGAALLAAIVISTLGSAGVVNPAIALGAGGYTADWWTVATYALAPLVGGAIGAWLYKLMAWDVENASKRAE